MLIVWAGCLYSGWGLLIPPTFLSFAQVSSVVIDFHVIKCF